MRDRFEVHTLKLAARPGTLAVTREVFSGRIVNDPDLPQLSFFRTPLPMGDRGFPHGPPASRDPPPIQTHNFGREYREQHGRYS